MSDCFDDAEFDLELVPQDGNRILVRSISFEGQKFCFRVTGQMADPVMDDQVVPSVLRLAALNDLAVRVLEN